MNWPCFGNKIIVSMHISPSLEWSAVQTTNIAFVHYHSSMLDKYHLLLPDAEIWTNKDMKWMRGNAKFQAWQLLISIFPVSSSWSGTWTLSFKAESHILCNYNQEFSHTSQWPCWLNWKSKEFQATAWLGLAGALGSGIAGSYSRILALGTWTSHHPASCEIII